MEDSILIFQFLYDLASTATKMKLQGALKMSF